MGSTAAARRAGSAVASGTITVMKAVVATRVTGSYTGYSIELAAEESCKEADGGQREDGYVGT